MGQLSKRGSDIQNGHHRSEMNGSIVKDPSQMKECSRSECHTSSKALHHFNCLPNHLQFNQFVRTGYRMNLNTWECMKSLLYCHNESFNVYSHGIPFIFFLFIAPYVYRQASSIQLYPFLYSIHYVTSTLCVLCSSAYHLMMCHRNGEGAYDKFIKLDMLGIWFVTAFGPTAFIYGTFLCFPRLYKVVSSVYYLIAVIGLINVVRGTTAIERIQPVIYVGLIRLPLYALRGYVVWMGYTSGPLSAIWLLLAMEMLGFLGAVINVSRFPEKWFCGKLDYFCNSHNIMHIVVLACPVMLHMATVADFKWLETAECPV